jgi:low temperature requirement protein LtrA
LVTWLELFFDLVFVAAVAQVAEPLREHYSIDGAVRFALLFVLIWWAWTGYTVFATRFDASDAIQRGLTLVQMFVVAAMAANAGEEIDGRSTAGFAAAYAVLRLVLVAQYVRARHVPEARPLTTRYIVGHGSAALLWLGSAFVPAPGRYLLWGVALLVDLGTPWLTLRLSARLPPDSEHLPERFGLFTLILLGEAVVSVMHGMRSHEDWAPAAAVSAVLGTMGVFTIWWWYFHGVDAASARHVRSRRDEVAFHLWTCAHFPLYLGLVVTAVGMEHVVTAAARSTLGSTEASFVLYGAALMMASLGLIAVTAGQMRTGWSHASRMFLVALATAGLGVAIAPQAPLMLMLTLSGAYAVQTIVIRASRSRGTVNRGRPAAELEELLVPD